MDIHRCRFVPYPAAAINALAFSHTPCLADSGRGPATLRLAIGRANGDIEIWNPSKGSWFQESILRGGRNRSIEGLVWTQDDDSDGAVVQGSLRLFSIGYSAVITEWDLALGKPKRHSGGNYGEIWCLAAQPRPSLSGADGLVQEPPSKEIQTEAQKIVVGCADGTLVIHTTMDDDLQFFRTLARPSGKKSRVLCVTFLSREIVVAGYADSTIRVFDVRNGLQIRSMSLGAGPVGAPAETLVWSVKGLVDGTIVSGDSTGEIKIWDGKTFTLVQRIKSHLADVLTVTASADGETIASGGMDRRSIVYRRVGTSNKRRWAEICHQRLHSHDVKVMACFETKHLSVLASGGLDTIPIIVPLREFGKEFSRSLSNLPQLPPLQSAPRKRMILAWWNREVSIWHVYSRRRIHDENGDTEGAEHKSRKLIAKIAFQGEENLTSATLAPDGSIVVVSTISEVKVFALHVQKSEYGDRIKVRKIEMPISISRTGARLIQISPDSKWLAIVRPNSSLEVHRIKQDSGTKKDVDISGKFVCLKRLARENVKSKLKYGTLGNYDRTVSHIAFSGDSRILVAGDISGYLDSWVLEGHEDLTQEHDVGADDDKSSDSKQGDEPDSDEEEQPIVILGQHWIRNPAAALLPRLPNAPLVLSFRPDMSTPPALTNGNTAVHPTRHNPHPHSHDLPNGEDRLLTLTCEHKIYEYKILAGKLSDWSRRNPVTHLPREFRDTRDLVMGLVWDISTTQERVWLYGSSWLWMFDLAKDLPVPETGSHGDEAIQNGVVENNKSSKKRKRESPREDVQRLHNHTTGAGSRIPDSKLDLGFGRNFRKIKGPESDNSKWISLETKPSPDVEEEEDDDGDDPARTLGLPNIRRGAVQNSQTSGNYGELMNSDGEPTSREYDMAVKQRCESGPPYWSTYKYRPILGIVPLGGGDDDENLELDHSGENDYEFKAGIEVALVERPLWDADLPPRYYGSQEWEK